MAAPPAIKNPDQLVNSDHPFTVYTSTALVATGVVFSVLSVIFVALRFYARHISRARLGIDDWIMIPALIITIATCVAQILAAELGGLGSHQQLGPGGLLVHYPGLVTYEKLKYVLQVMGTFNVGIIKLSVLLMYRRIFYTGAFPAFKIGNNIAIVVVAAWTLAFTFALAFQCTPVSIIWTEFEISYSEFCVQVQFLYLGVAVSDFILDVLILLLPLPPILRLQIPRRQQIAVLGIFLLGAIVVASGIARMVTFYQVVDFTEANPIVYFTDIQWYTSGTLFWVPIEDCIAIIGACLPMLRPVFMRASEKTKLSGSRNQYGNSSSGNGHGGSRRLHGDLSSGSHQKLNSTSSDDRGDGTFGTHTDVLVARDHVRGGEFELHNIPASNQIRIQREFYAGPAGGEAS